jgi:hypothetical protein
MEGKLLGKKLAVGPPPPEALIATPVKEPVTSEAGLVTRLYKMTTRLSNHLGRYQLTESAPAFKPSVENYTERRPSINNIGFGKPVSVSNDSYDDLLLPNPSLGRF